MISPMRHLLRAMLVVVPFAICATLHAAEPVGKKSEFLRFNKDAANGSAKLEVAIGSYANDKGQTVDLVSAVHIADASYFHALNERFKTYDAVLYEMVKPEGAGVPEPGAAPQSMIGGMQMFLTRSLELTFQLDEVDYGAPNFVHADLTAEAFERRMGERGESLFSIMLRAMLNDMSKPKTGKQVHPDVQLGQLIFALQAPDRPRQLKLFLGEQFTNIDEQVAMLEGPDGSVILTERNDAAMQVCRDELAAGKKKLAIFYGAAHLRGMETELVKKMGFKPKGQEWLVAWDIPAAPKVAATAPATQPAK